LGEAEEFRISNEGPDPTRSDSLPSVEHIAKALGPIVRRGLPVVPEFDDETLLSLPNVLIRTTDPCDRLGRVNALDELLRWHLSRYPDDRLKEVVAVLFGAAQGSRRQPIGDRRRESGRHLGVSAEHVRTGIQPGILQTLAWEIHRDAQDSLPTLGVSAGSARSGAGGDLVAERTSGAIEQLYRYLQEVTLRLEAADFCARCSLEIPASNRYRDTARFVSEQPSMNGDLALWMFTYVHLYFNEVLRDKASRDFLRENLPLEWWVWTRLDRPFLTEELEVLLQALSSAKDDDPHTFALELIEGEHGALRGRWSAMLASVEWPVSPIGATMPWERPTARHRGAAIEAARLACAVLQSRFGSLTMEAKEAEREFLYLVENTVDIALSESGVSAKNSDGRALEAIPRAALDARPPRYLQTADESVDWGVPFREWFSS